jgi:serine/threonine-protein kinase
VAQLMQRDPQQRPRDGTIAAQMLRAVLGTTRDLTDLVYEAFQGLPGAVWDEEADGSFRVHLTFRDERSQVVHLENSEHSVGERLLLIYSLCCEARPSFYEEALRLNASLQHGGISIRDIDGRPCFVMVDTYPRGTVTAEDIRRSVFELGSRADSIEQRLTGRDVN